MTLTRKLNKAVTKIGGKTKAVNEVSAKAGVSTFILWRIFQGFEPRQERLIKSLNSYFKKEGIE